MIREDLERLSADLEKEADAIQQFLEIEPSGDANELVDRLNMLNVFLARSAKMLADAKRVLDYKRADAIERYGLMISQMAKSVQPKMLEAKTADANYLVNWIERINRTIVHQGDNIRTQVSFEKESLRLTKSGY